MKKAVKVDLPGTALAYAAILDVASRAGILLLIGTFLIYVCGIIPSRIAPADMPKYWHLSLKEFHAVHGAHTGWSWVLLLPQSDLLAFAAIAFLVMVTFLCYVRILPPLIRMKDHAYAVIAAIELVVLVLAASGVLHAGH